MGFLDLFRAASMPVLQLLIVTALGAFLALESVNILGESTRKQLNELVFFVFNPALVGSKLAETITFESLLSLWFMPVNILLTFVIGSLLGWVLMMIAKPAQHLKGLVLGTCSAGNLGNMLFIIVPAICKEKGAPFGDADVCSVYGLAYASLSMAIGSVFLWTYVYNLVRVFSKDSGNNRTETVQEELSVVVIPVTVPQPPSSELELSSNDGKMKVMLDSMKQQWRNFSSHINWKAVFAPSTIGAIVGFVIGTIAPIRRLLIGTTAPLRVLQDSASLVGEASIPAVTLIMGANLLRGLKGSGMSISLVLGIAGVRYIFLPGFGILIVKGALRFGLVRKDPLYLFILLLQFALPPAMNLSTMTQLFGAGESDCSVIMLWTYGLASIALTLWSTFFMWLVA